MESVHWETRDLHSLFVNASDGLGGWLLRAQQHCVFTAVHKQLHLPGLDGVCRPVTGQLHGLSAAVMRPSAPSWLSSWRVNSWTHSRGHGRSGYWLDFELIKTHWKYGILPVIQRMSDYSVLSSYIFIKKIRLIKWILLKPNVYMYCNIKKSSVLYTFYYNKNY